MTLRIAVSEDPEGHTVVLAGELVLDTTGAPRAELAALLAGAAPGARVRLDLAGLTLLDSSELSVLIRAHKTAAEHGGACCSRTRPVDPAHHRSARRAPHRRTVIRATAGCREPLAG